MLGKLLKYECKETGKVLLPLNLALIIITSFGCVLIGLGVFDSDSVALNILLISMILFYMVAIIALLIGSYIYLTVRFYRSMYSAEAYLTHTLPASTLSILNVKIIVSVFWVYLTMLLTVCSGCALIVSGVASAGAWRDFSLTQFDVVMQSLFGTSTGGFIAWCAVFGLVSSCSSVLMIYCSLSIGQLFNKYRVLAAIITYGIIYIMLQIINTIITIRQTSLIFSGSDDYYSSDLTLSSLSGGSFHAIMILQIILSIIYYVTCELISRKKLNLE